MSRAVTFTKSNRTKIYTLVLPTVRSCTHEREGKPWVQTIVEAETQRNVLPLQAGRPLPSTLSFVMIWRNLLIRDNVFVLRIQYVCSTLVGQLTVFDDYDTGILLFLI